MNLQLRENYQLKIEQKVESFFSAYEERFPGLVEMSRYHFETGGKRLRAMIPSLVFESLNKNGDEILPFGLAVEMIHNATLVHDDLQDGDEMRRGRPTVWKKYSSAQAINCGDGLFQFAFLALNDLKFPSEIKTKMIAFMAEATNQVIEGQAQEFLMKEEPFPTLERYMQVIRGKTSGLFSLPICGALQAINLDVKNLKPVQGIAEDLGLLFQVQDDVLDIYGAKGRGRIGSDIAEGKISFLVAYVFSKAEEKIKLRLKEIIAKPREKTSDEDIAEATAIFNETGAKKAAFDFFSQVEERLESQTFLKKEMPGLYGLMKELASVFLEPVLTLKSD